MYRLENVEETHRESPWRRSIPRRAVREALPFGALVKLVFRVDAPARSRVTVERIWVRVKSFAFGAYTGTLETPAFHLAGLTRGDLVRFGPEHVAEVEAPDGQSERVDPKKLAMVSKRILDAAQLPLSVRREPPPDTAHSGWWILSGEERSAELADRGNFEEKTLDDMCTRYPALDSVLDAPAGTSWAWDHAALEYREVASRR